MTRKEAIYILRNAAWLGSNEERQKLEEAVEVVANAIEAQDMILHMNLPEVSVEEAIEILKRNSRFELISSGKDINVPSNDTISRQATITEIKNYERDSTAPIDYVHIVEQMPPAQLSRIERELHGKAPEEQYEILYQLMFEYANTFNDARRAVIDWLGE